MNLSPRNLTDDPVSVSELLSLDIASSDAESLCERIAVCLTAATPSDQWMQLVSSVLTPELPFALHRWLYDCVYFANDSRQGPPAAWFPTKDVVERANVTQLANSLGLPDYQSLWDWANENRVDYWNAVAASLNINFTVPPTSMIAEPPSTELAGPVEWLPGARFNIVDSCFQAAADKVAVFAQNEDGETNETTYGELQSLVNRVANGLQDSGFVPGDRIGIMLPMTAESVAAYLGAIKAGCVPVSIAESFAPSEISIRMRLASVKAIFLTDVVNRAGKQLPCFRKFAETDSEALAIVIPSCPRNQSSLDINSGFRLNLRRVMWDEFLSDSTSFKAISTPADAEINILFSSGTTGEPKAIPWTQATPLKCAADAKFHQNIHENSVVAWPTSLGWMMGPWLIYASLINKATMALFDGSANSPAFCRFVMDARVTMLGVIPSLVRAWKNGGMIEGLDWSSIEVFSSTGECSNATDMLYLMSRAGYRPIIEYCGGTEIGGGYLTSTVVQPIAPGCFTTPALGLNLELVSDDKLTENGEVFLVGPSIGLSQTLLNADHHTVYFANTPEVEGLPPLRRHGDTLIRFPNGNYQACGRSDDAMNLGGIKVSAVELERCLNLLPSVHETACIAAAQIDGGPAELVVFAVPSSNDTTVDQLRTEMQSAISKTMNPLFRVRKVILRKTLPRTASNKIMRRSLRELVAR